MNRKGGTGGGEWEHLKDANSMAASVLGLAVNSPCLEPGGPFLGF